MQLLLEHAWTTVSISVQYCTYVYIVPFSAFEVDSDVQLVCKYLNAYHQKDDPIHGINRVYELPPGGSVVIGHDVLT